jgi:predicted patatin/cPLA2 family phospholipase
MTDRSLAPTPGGQNSAFERSLRPPEIPEGVHPVFDLIRARLADGSEPGARRDAHVLALAIEGGGMRGVASAGMTLALEYFGTRTAFDLVYGSSAGSMMGAYFISGQASLAPSIYSQDLSNRRFISRRGFVSKRPVLDLDYLVDHVIGMVKPLDYEVVLSSPIELHVLTTCVERAGPVDFSGFKSKEELREALRASARLPWIAGGPVLINGESYYDSGLSESLPFASAIRGGATHVLVLKTRARGGSPETFSRRQQWLMRRVLRLDPRVIDLLVKRPALYESEVRELERVTSADSSRPPHVKAIFPEPADRTITRLSRNQHELEAVGKVGIQSVYRALQLPAPKVFEVLRPYPTS